MFLFLVPCLDTYVHIISFLSPTFPMDSCPFCACNRPRNHPRSMSISAYNLRSIISVQCVDSYNDITTVTIMTSGGQPRRHPGGNHAAGLGRPVTGILWLPHGCSPGYEMSISVGTLGMWEKVRTLKILSPLRPRNLSSSRPSANARRLQSRIRS